MSWVATVAMGLVGVGAVILLESRADVLRRPEVGVAAAGERESARRPRTRPSIRPLERSPSRPGRTDISVPVLMYHVIGEPPASPGGSELYVAEADFVGQLDWLQAHGYTAVTLGDVWEHWHGRRVLPRRPVVVTLDDGTRSTYTRAFPALGAKGWVGVLNLDVSNLEPAWGLDPAKVRALLDAGWEVASHSLTHADLTGLDLDALTREVAGSRAAIHRLFGVTATFFCYPSGRFDEHVVEAVEDAGYLGATTTIYGLADRRDPYRLARVRVDRSDGIAGFARKLAELDPS